MVIELNFFIIIHGYFTICTCKFVPIITIKKKSIKFNRCTQQNNNKERNRKKTHICKKNCLAVERKKMSRADL